MLGFVGLHYVSILLWPIANDTYQLLPIFLYYSMIGHGL